MKVTDEEKVIIRFLKKEMSEARAYEKDARKELIQGLKNKPYDSIDFEHYDDARNTYLVLAGLYYSFVDEIATRFKHEIRHKS